MVDVLIVLIVIFQAIHWAKIGLIKGGFSLLGFGLGLLAGSLVAPWFTNLVDTQSAKLALAMIVIIAGGAVFGVAGRLVGDHLSGLSKKIKLGRLDGILGAGFGVLVSLVFIWLFASILSGVQSPQLSQSLRDSAILRAMNERLPPAPAVMARITGFINSHGFPQVFVGFEPSPVEPVEIPSSEVLSQALASAGASTVRIESLGCGGAVNGSGFVAGSNLVVTNAHVVAGINNPAVVDRNGYHRATTIYFDKDSDIAVLRTENLAGRPLRMAEQAVPRGTSAAELGYPGGGRLEVGPAGILRQMLARGRDIYGRDVTVRTIYELQASVESGNSGGPVVLPDGTVIGVVFARSQTESTRGYAIISTSVLPIVKEVRNSTQAVGTGACVPR